MIIFIKVLLQYYCQQVKFYLNQLVISLYLYLVIIIVIKLLQVFGLRKFIADKNQAS